MRPALSRFALDVPALILSLTSRDSRGGDGIDAATAICADDHRAAAAGRAGFLFQRAEQSPAR